MFLFPFKTRQNGLIDLLSISQDIAIDIDIDIEIDIGISVGYFSRHYDKIPGRNDVRKENLAFSQGFRGLEFSRVEKHGMAIRACRGNPSYHGGLEVEKTG